MGVDGRMADRKGKEEAAGKEEVAAKEKRRSAKKNKRRQKKSPPMPTVVQRLFDTCKEVFADCGADVVPAAEDIERLRAILDDMKPEDVGLTPNLPCFRSNAVSQGPPVITYLSLYESPKFSICIFCMPKSAVIPLHNHPGMTVFSKILFGSMHIKSYDWVSNPQNSNEMVRNTDGARLAKVNTDDVFKVPCNTSILYPAAGGNMHRFTAVTPCAVLDVLGPPYSTYEGRDCTYYNDDLPYLRSSGDVVFVPDEHERYAWLKERVGMPDDCFVLAAEYKGPKIVEH
ncbi:plant cysteine oxidase 2 [Elaeis guineensis]|uniref:cysteine dioxygenase n=1 Tax=Elaeis guineensis var. tenera TaxID=51953 RepID=A0A6I9RY32_ELAGV|nr:plant cysteine oxidase 2 [Elaeis guineensis]